MRCRSPIWADSLHLVQETGLHLSQESLEQLMPPNDSTLKEKQLVGTLQITFVHNEPDLLREVPAVPG